VNTNIQIDNFTVSSHLLSSLGIIINELITNSMKYAFNESENNMIMLQISKSGNLITIKYGDNGIGIPENITLENSSGFGMQLINMLMQQLEGTARIERGNGTKFIIQLQV
jgi:two-component sensor histidine kinase